MKRDYSIREVAAAVGVSYRTILRRVEDGIIPARRYGPKSTKIDRKTLILLKQHGLAGLPAARRFGYREVVA